MATIKVIGFAINLHPKSKYHCEPTSKVYKISHIDHLVQTINSEDIHKIKNIVFYFTIGLSTAAFIYETIKNGSDYIFAPCYNKMTYTTILENYKTEMINTLMTTITEISSNIKNTFIDRIDETKEIIHVFRDD